MLQALQWIIRQPSKPSKHKRKREEVSRAFQDEDTSTELEVQRPDVKISTQAVTDDNKRGAAAIDGQINCWSKSVRQKLGQKKGLQLSQYSRHKLSFCPKLVYIYKYSILLIGN